MKNIKPIDDLELYELIVMAYPDKFDENSDEDIWDDVMEFVEQELGGIDTVSNLLERIVMMTNPIQSCLSNKFYHCLGNVKLKQGEVYMTTAISRSVKEFENE